jgi:hypothetical protein
MSRWALIYRELLKVFTKLIEKYYFMTEFQVNVLYGGFRAKHRKEQIFHEKLIAARLDKECLCFLRNPKPYCRIHKSLSATGVCSEVNSIQSIFTADFSRINFNINF